MVTLTLQQRNLLHLILQSESPMAMAQLAEQTNLSSRQVNYRLKPVKIWLAGHGVNLVTKPGVGVAVSCSADQRHNLLQELNTEKTFQLVLLAGQRQQLFALGLLVADTPLILGELQFAAAVSRTTVFKDIDLIEDWLRTFDLTLVRRPNYGIEIAGSEMMRRQALTALLWGDMPFETPLTNMTHHSGLTFSLAGASAPPLIRRAVEILKAWNTQTAFEWVAIAEALLGGRFTDYAVLHLALSFALQAQRVRSGHLIQISADQLAWLQEQKAWAVAVELADTIWSDSAMEKPVSEIGVIAMYLLSTTRDHMWPGDLEIDPALTELIGELMAEVSMALATPGLKHDTPLRDGLVANLIPAYMHQRFGLWAPPAWPGTSLAQRYSHEFRIARELARLVTERTGVVLQVGDIDTLVLLLRAAFIRESTSRPRRVLIICPSGMATAQLLQARLKARFPSLEILGVLSVRELTNENVAGAQLLISTVPVESPRHGLQVIQVHPLLLPEDIDTITQWLS